MGGSPHHYLAVDTQLRAVLGWFGALVAPTERLCHRRRLQGWAARVGGRPRRSRGVDRHADRAGPAARPGGARPEAARGPVHLRRIPRRKTSSGFRRRTLSCRCPVLPLSRGRPVSTDHYPGRGRIDPDFSPGPRSGFSQPLPHARDSRTKRNVASKRCAMSSPGSACPRTTSPNWKRLAIGNPPNLVEYTGIARFLHRGDKSPDDKLQLRRVNRRLGS